LTEYRDFKIIRELWNVYLLSDNAILKTRLILIKVIFEGIDEANNPIYLMNSDNVVGVLSPEGALGKPSTKRYTPEERVSAIEQDLDFETKEEGWNKYELNDGATIEIKLVLTKVSKTSLYDSRGEPIYLVNIQPITRSLIPKELRQKLKSMKT